MRGSQLASKPAALRQGWLSHSGADLLLVAAVLVVHLLLAHFAGVAELLGGIPVERRPGLYSASAIVVSLTGTLASVTVAQYLSGKGDRMAHLKATFPGQLARTWKAIFLGSVTSVILFLVAYGLDSRESGLHVGTWAFEAGAVLAALRFVRLALLFGDLVEIIVLDDTDPLGEASFDLTPEFFRGASGSRR